MIKLSVKLFLFCIICSSTLFAQDAKESELPAVSPEITIYPTLIARYAIINFVTDLPTTVTIEIYDVNGNRISTMIETYQVINGTDIEFSRDLFQNPGIYLLKFSYNQKSEFKRVYVI